MKKVHLMLLLCISFNPILGQPGSEQIINNFNKLTWLEGTWHRANGKAGQSEHEHWAKTSAYELQGFSVSIKGMDTLFMEKLRIVTRNDNLYYVADVPKNQKPVYFKLTEVTDTSFVCQNPDHDFPKQIAYQRNGNQLTAIISGNGKSIDFTFKKE